MVPWAARYSQTACVMARMCASVNVPFSEVPRWPLVPKATELLRIAEIGRALVIIADEAIDVDQQFARGRLAGERRDGHRRGLRGRGRV